MNVIQEIASKEQFVSITKRKERYFTFDVLNISASLNFPQMHQNPQSRNKLRILLRSWRDQESRERIVAPFKILSEITFSVEKKLKLGERNFNRKYIFQ